MHGFRKTYLKTVNCRLSDEELLEYGQAQAQKLALWADIDSARQMTAKAYKDQLNALENQIDKYTKAINSGEEEREVDVYDLVEDRHVITYRADDNQEVDRRPATSEDHQVLFDFTDNVGDSESMYDTSKSALEFAQRAGKRTRGKGPVT